MMQLLLIALVATFAAVSCSPGGAPPAACETMIPDHGQPIQTTPLPYTITVDKTSIKAGDTVEVTLTGQGSNKIQGFMVQARVGTTPIGEFDKTPTVNLVDCGKGAKNAATHTSPSNKDKVVITWHSPKGLSETVKFRVTIAQDGATYWVDKWSDGVAITA